MCLVIDTWAKLPSAVFSVYSYEFGEFSRCFNIKRQEKFYRTQYCMGQLVLQLEPNLMINLSNPINKTYYPSRFLLPQ